MHPIDEFGGGRNDLELRAGEAVVVEKAFFAHPVLAGGDGMGAGHEGDSFFDGLHEGGGDVFKLDGGDVDRGDEILEGAGRVEGVFYDAIGGFGGTGNIAAGPFENVEAHAAAFQRDHAAELSAPEDADPFSRSGSDHEAALSSLGGRTAASTFAF